MTVKDKQGKKYFIQQFLQEEYLHGGVGGSDAEKILLSKGFVPVVFPHQHHFSLKAKINRFFFLLKMVSRIKQRDRLVFLSPVHARMSKLLLYWLGKKKNVQIICFIADINGIKDGDERLLEKEISFFRRFSHFIVHNDKMKEWLYKNVSGNSVAMTIEFFDFLTKPVTPQSVPSYEIVFAGNLGKSQFTGKLHLLESISPALHFHLYGSGLPGEAHNQKNITWHGIKRPYDLPGRLKGSFGLVWDGESLDGPGGSLGNYMQYISHHKLSLYILSKLPLIVPATAASAPLVEKYRIGFTVNSLYEIGEKINKLPAADYYEMQNNMQQLAERISTGQCLGNVVDKLLAMSY